MLGNGVRKERSCDSRRDSGTLKKGIWRGSWGRYKGPGAVGSQKAGKGRKVWWLSIWHICGRGEKSNLAAHGWEVGKGGETGVYSSVRGGPSRRESFDGRRREGKNFPKVLGHEGQCARCGHFEKKCGRVAASRGESEDCMAKVWSCGGENMTRLAKSRERLWAPRWAKMARKRSHMRLEGQASIQGRGVPRITGEKKDIVVGG